MKRQLSVNEKLKKEILWYLDNFDSCTISVMAAYTVLGAELPEKIYWKKKKVTLKLCKERDWGYHTFKNFAASGLIREGTCLYNIVNGKLMFSGSGVGNERSY
jgi:hypothetical protein